MDIVITYVNGLDPIWQKDYEKYTKVPIMVKRFRDWGTLKYLLRGIQENMPFINNVFLVVSHPSQVPQWVNPEKLKVVLHSDFVPQEYLPTFNCNTLEMNLHKIEGLDEQFLYFNDDMFPMREMNAERFYQDGKAIMGYTKHYWGNGMFKQICKNSDSLAKKALGMKKGWSFVRPQHVCSPMLKSECEKLSKLVEKEINSAYTITRTSDNYNQYLFLDYMYYSGKIINKRLRSKHLSVAVSSTRKICSYILNSERDLICINDVNIGENKFLEMQKAIIDAFKQKFPDKSRFEL